MPIVFPGTVLAMGLLWAYIFVPIGIYGTIWILLIAYFTRFLPYANRSLSSSVIRINPEMDEAAAVCGSGLAARLWNIMIPLTKGGLGAAWIIVGTNYLQELTTSALLYSSGSEVAGVTLFQLFQYNAWNLVSALSVVMTVLATVFTVIVLFITRTNRNSIQAI